MKVLKFGGTSVGTASSLRNVKNIIEGNNEPVMVIVSALGGLTDKLIATSSMAASGNDGYIEEVASIRKRHHDIVEEVIAADRKEKVLSLIDPMLDELENIYHGISLIHDVPEKTLCLVVSFGERISSVIVANMIEEAEHHNSLNYVKTEKWFNKNIADRKLTDRLIRKEFEKPLQRTVVMGGFISTDRDSGEITNLGRGGSDYTAALVAAALDADILEIWTDVDGFLTADPRIIADARIIDAMSFIESMELCSYGAKVIYPPTIYPVFHKNIPIKILNTFNPQAPGTLITDTPAGGKVVVRGISALKSTSMVTVSGKLVENFTEINSRAFNSLARKGINVFLVVEPDVKDVFSFIIQASDGENAVRILEEEFAPEIHSGVVDEVKLSADKSIIAVVGEGIKSRAGIAGEIMRRLSDNSVNVSASSEKASETTLGFVVDAADVDKSLRLVHEVCFS